MIIYPGRSMTAYMRSHHRLNVHLADDDDIETDIRVRYLDIAGPPAPELPEPEVTAEAANTDVQMLLDVPCESEHGKTADGDPAYCRRATEDLVDCQACLAEAEASLLADELNEHNRPAVDKLLAVLRDAGAAGITKRQLLVSRACQPLHSIKRNVHLVDISYRRFIWTPFPQPQQSLSSSARRTRLCRSPTGLDTLRSRSSPRRTSGPGRSSCPPPKIQSQTRTRAQSE